MKIKRALKRILELTGYTIRKLPATGWREAYDEDGLWTQHNHDFMLDASFCQAYERGVLAAGADYRFHWRVYVGLWAASSASKLKGDFVECGVNRGFMSSAIMRYLDWNSLDRTFYLMDTFGGLDERYVSAEELARGALDSNKRQLQTGYYTTNVEAVRANFSQWQRVQFVVGAIPETLAQVQTRAIAYLHLDMNCAPPEVAAFQFFWERLVPGAFVLLDDYAYKGGERQKAAMDAAAAEKGLRILSLPTGQGLLVKPA